jgi:hypothetical protein
MSTFFFLIFSVFFGNTFTHFAYTIDSTEITFTVNKIIHPEKNNNSYGVKTKAMFNNINNEIVICEHTKLQKLNLPFIDFFLFFRSTENVYNQASENFKNYLTNITLECNYSNYIIKNGRLIELVEKEIIF